VIYGIEAAAKTGKTLRKSPLDPVLVTVVLHIETTFRELLYSTRFIASSMKNLK
jgi:hypothetical protein